MAKNLEIFARQQIKNHYERHAEQIRATNFLSDYAADLLQEKLSAINLPYQKILNLGCGSTKLDSFLAKKFPNCTITETSYSANFLKSAKSSNQQIICDEENLPFAPNSFELIFSILNLHKINRLPETLFKIRELLTERGAFIACFIGGESLTELRAACLAADAGLNSASAKVAPMIEVKTAGMLLQKTGFHLPVADSEKVTLEYSNVEKFLYDLKEAGEGNFLTQKSKQLMSKKRLNLIKENYLKNNSKDNIISATIEFINLTGFKS